MSTPGTTYDVLPKDYTKVITKVEVTNVNVVLFNGATFYVNLRDSNGVFIYNTTLYMNQQTYLEWNNDDTFAKNWIMQQLELTPVPTP